MEAPGKDYEEIRECLKAHGYVLLDPIGSGRFGSVFTVRSVKFDVVYVVKVLDKEDSQGENHEADFQSEVEVLMNLTHPNIVSVYAYFSSTKYDYVILEYCENGSLAELLTRHSCVSGSLLACYCRQLVEALAYLHSNHFCHRDIKPANILIDQHRRLKLADFGFAARSNEATIKTICGSLPYMAPELIKRLANTDGAASDVWALGVTFYEMATGSLPWATQSPSQLSWDILEGGLTFERDMPVLLVKMLTQMIEHVPSKRITMSELLEMPFLQKEVAGVRPRAIARRADGRKRASSLFRLPVSEWKPVAGTPEPRIYV
jgi:serine/threonine protein kinase